MNDSGFVRLRRLSTDEIVGTDGKAGLIERYFSLMPEGDTTLQDIDLSAREMRIGDNRLCLHTLSDAEDLPGKVATDTRYEKLSTDRSDCRLSFASPVGLLLSCNHIYNQYVIIDNSEENLQKFEKSARNMQSLSRYSRSNSINREWIDQYLNEAHSYGLTSVRAHFNVMAWSDDAEELKHIKNDVGSQLASMECVPRHNTIDCPTLYWAAMPGNAADFPAEESFHTFIEQAVCLFTEETNYRSSLSPFGIKMVDRLTGKPLHLDISDLPMKRGITTNRNKFVLGPSGSGKSFFMNHLVRQYYEQGRTWCWWTRETPIRACADDTAQDRRRGRRVFHLHGGEAHQLQPVLHRRLRVRRGEEGQHQDAAADALEVGGRQGDEDGERRTGQCRECLYRAHQDRPEHRPLVQHLLRVYARRLPPELAERDIKVEKSDFNIDNMLTTMRQYYRGGRYDFLLNSTENIDLLGKRFIVFEIDSIKENRELFPVVTIIIMEAFINKMRRLKGVRKQLIVEEAWKALSSANMAEYLRYMYKTVRKYYGEAIVVTQEVDDIISSPVVKESIINNSDCKILLDQRKYMNKFDQIQALLGLTEKRKAQILSINMANNPSRLYKEVWIGLGGTQSAVYATEVSAEEYLAYTTEETEKWRFTVWRSSWAATSKPPSGSLPKGGETRNKIIKNRLSTKKENAYEYIKNENAASQQVFNRAGGHGAAILRRGGQPPRHAVRKLGERGGQARRAYLQGGRSLQGDGVQAERHPPQAEAGNLSLAGGERQPVHEHGIPHRRVLQRGHGRADLLAKRGLCAGEAAAGNIRHEE